MIRFKVVKGSHLLLVFAVIVLAAVLAFILIQEVGFGNPTAAVPTQTASS